MCCLVCWRFSAGFAKTTVLLQHQAFIFTWQAVLAAGSKLFCWLESTAVWTWPTKTTVFLQHRAAMFTWQAVLAAGSKLFTEIYCSVDLANKIRCVSTTPGSHTWQAVLAAGSKLFTGIYCSVHLANKNSTHKVQIKLVSALSPRIAWSLLRI